jgi:uncharacterized protein YegP (UPF0339 family)
MPNRYEYDLDRNGEWRWIAIAETGETAGVSPVGYKDLQDCMHAVGLLRSRGDFAVLPSNRKAQEMDPPEKSPPEKSLSRLQRRPSVT